MTPLSRYGSHPSGTTTPRASLYRRYSSSAAAVSELRDDVGEEVDWQCGGGVDGADEVASFWLAAVMEEHSG